MLWWLLMLPTVMGENGTADVPSSNFSLPPSNIPITTVNILGKQVFIHEPLQLPKRPQEVNKDVEKDDGQSLTSKIFSPFLAKVDNSVGDKSSFSRRHRESYASQPKTAYEVPKNAYAVAAKSKYPLPQCYTNQAGFMCCNKNLEQLMHDTFDKLAADPKWQNCNSQKIANLIQDNAQKMFGTDFEAVTGIGDFASKTHFYSDLICKTEKQGRFLLAYATPGRHNKQPYRVLRDQPIASSHTVMI